MVLNKFGDSDEYLENNNVKGVPGIGFKLTDDGHYDIQNKKLCNVGMSENVNDACKKYYVDQLVLDSMIKIETDIKIKTNDMGKLINENTKSLINQRLTTIFRELDNHIKNQFKRLSIPIQLRYNKFDEDGFYIREYSISNDTIYRLPFNIKIEKLTIFPEGACSEIHVNDRKFKTLPDGFELKKHEKLRFKRFISTDNVSWANISVELIITHQ